MKFMNVIKMAGGIATALTGGIVALKASKGLKTEDASGAVECTMSSIEDDIKDDIESEEEEEKEEET